MTDQAEEEQLVPPEHEKFTQFNEAELQRDEVLYEDQKIQITNKGILLHSYWFPFALKKFIPFDHIRGHELRRNVPLFSMKSWGMGADFEVWWHMDFKKSFGERNAIILDAGGWPKIGFCPGEGELAVVERAYAIIESHCHVL